MDYSKFKDSYDENLIAKWKNHEVELDVETLRSLLYGYTFKPEYTNGVIEDALSMDYWKERAFEDDDDDSTSSFDLDADIMDDLEKAMENVDMYEVETPQERLLMEVLDSTGDGMTPETAICVIDVSQEYEYLERKFPFSCLCVEKQTHSGGIDCLYFKENAFDEKCIYFDISRKLG